MRRAARGADGAATGPAAGPLGFDLVIPFDTPFLYDPKDGNLLVEVINLLGSEPDSYALDAHLAVDPTSCVWTDPGDSGHPLGKTDSIGLVVRFDLGPTISEIPAVSTRGALALLGALALAGLVVRSLEKRSGG